MLQEEERTAGIWPKGHVYIQGPHKSRPRYFRLAGEGYTALEGGRGVGEGGGGGGGCYMIHQTTIAFNMADFTLFK
jgi:hypothetical protein